MYTLTHQSETTYWFSKALCWHIIIHRHNPYISNLLTYEALCWHIIIHRHNQYVSNLLTYKLRLPVDTSSSTDITNTRATYWLIRLPVDTSSSTDITITHVQLTDLVRLSVDTSSSQWCICLATDSSHSPPLVVTVLQSVWITSYCN